MRKYGTDHKDKLIGELESIKALVPSTPYSRTIEPIEIDEEHKFFKIACWETAKEAHDQVYKVTKKARVVKNIITEFYGGVDTNATEILAAATKVSDMLIEANSVLQRMDAALCSVGDYQGRKVTSSILEEAGVNKDEFSKLSTEAWNKICDIEIANNAITETATNIFVKRINSMLKKGETLSKEDAKRVDPMYAVYLKRFNGKNVTPTSIEKNIMRNLYNYYVDHRFDSAINSTLVKEITLQNCIIAYENLYPEHKEIFDAFLKKGYDEHNDEIDLNIKHMKYEVYTSELKYRKLIFMYLPQLELNLKEPGTIPFYCPGKIDEDGNEIKPSLNLVLKNNTSILQRSDSAFCHEFGHALDDLFMEDFTDEDGNVRRYRSIRFKETLRSDFENHLIDTIKRECPDLKKEDRDILVDFIISRENVNVYVDSNPDYFRDLLPDWKPELKDAFETIRSYYGYADYIYDKENVYIKKERGNYISMFDSILDDIVGGITNNQFGGIGGHSIDSHKNVDPEKVTDPMKLHDALINYNYWYNSNGTTTDSYNTEFFAENFDYHMKERDLTKTREVFGNSCDLFEKTLDEILKESLGENTNK